MEFDKSKVITCFNDNLKQWVGWKGYFSDTIISIKSACLMNKEPTELIKIVKDLEFIFKSKDSPFRTRCFYPVEPPKKKMVREKR